MAKPRQQPGVKIVRADKLERVLDAPRHEMLVTRQEFMVQSALSAKSSSTFAKPVTVLPLARNSPFDSLA